MRVSRKVQWAATIALTGLLATGCGAPGGADASKPLSSGDVPDKPSKAVTLNILDVAGNLQLTGKIFDDFAKEHPDIISSVTWETAGAPDLAGKIKAQQQAGNLKIDLVLTGTDGLAAGISQSLFTPIAADFKDRLSNMNNYQEPGRSHAEAGAGPGRGADLVPVRTAAGVQPGQGGQPAEDRRRTAGLGQGEPRASSTTPARPTPARAAPS